jgi:hypothetical protein
MIEEGCLGHNSALEGLYWAGESMEYPEEIMSETCPVA